MVFYAKNKKDALAELKRLTAKDKKKYSRYKSVQLAKKQLKNKNKLKTWRVI